MQKGWRSGNPLCQAHLLTIWRTWEVLGHSLAAEHLLLVWTQPRCVPLPSWPEVLSVNSGHLISLYTRGSWVRHLLKAAHWLSDLPASPFLSSPAFLSVLPSLLTSHSVRSGWQRNLFASVRAVVMSLLFCLHQAFWYSETASKDPGAPKPFGSAAGGPDLNWDLMHGKAGPFPGSCLTVPRNSLVFFSKFAS